MDSKKKYATLRKPVEPTIFQTVGGISSYPTPRDVNRASAPLLPPRPLLPSLAPPDEPAPPPPARPALPGPPPGWISTYHAAPAAYPRLMAEGHGTLDRASHPWGAPAVGESSAERDARTTQETIDNVRGRYDAKYWSIEEAQAKRPPKQWVSMERWRRIEPTGGYTLLCAHAGGLQKEHWHEVICPIIEHSAPTNKDRFGGGRLAHPAPVEIDEVWMMDDLYHNESVTLSAGRLGPVQSWEDTGRDLLNVAEHVLPAIPVGVDAPWDLPWTAEGTPRKLIGVGHSFGGAATAHAAHARPDLFSAIFLVDPVTIPHVVLREPGYADPIKWYGPTTVVLRRRDVWPSRKAAREILRPSSFFARIAAPQFEVYLNRALVPVNPADPDGPVTLATPIWAEACVFTETDAGPRSYDKLAHLPMPVGWVMAGNSATTRGDESTQEMVARPPRAINERHLAAGHLMTQEDPQVVSKSLWRFLATLSADEWDTTPATAHL